MSDNKGDGIFAAALLGIWCSVILLALFLSPIFLVRRFGRVPVAAACAVALTLAAIFSPELVAMAKDVLSCCGQSLASPAAQAILELDKIGWWTLAEIMWATVFALILVSDLLRAPAEGHDGEPN